MIRFDEYLDFDQIRILPNYGTGIDHRETISTGLKLFGHTFKIPVVIPSMTTVVSQKLICNVERAGGLVIQPRNKQYKADVLSYNSSLDTCLNVASRLPQNGILSIEIAHGGMERMFEAIRQVKKAFPYLNVIAGTICTKEQAQYLIDAGANAVLAGIGVGSACSTTSTTGVGLPMFGTLLELQNIGVPVISAGGLRSKADFCKALAVGADMCMVGGLLKGCLDLNNPDSYNGMASATEKGNKHYVEGKEITTVPLDKTSYDVIIELKEALQSCMSYVGAANLIQFRNLVRFARVK